MSGVASVLLADDHARTRAMVRSALQRAGNFLVCAEAADAAGAVQKAKEEQPDVCLLDINMPGNGIAAWPAEITAALPGTAVVMLTVSRHDEDLFDAFGAEARGLSPEGTRRGEHRGVAAAGARRGGDTPRDAGGPTRRGVPRPENAVVAMPDGQAAA